MMRRYAGDLVAIATDAMVARPLADWCGARAASGSRVYRYRLDHPGGGPRLRATHTAEVPLVFGTYGDGEAGERLGGHASGARAGGRCARSRMALVPARTRPRLASDWPDAEHRSSACSAASVRITWSPATEALTQA